jgi:hypothetical protein
MGETAQGENPQPIRVPENEIEKVGLNEGPELQTRRVFDRVADFCNGLPFIGKMLIAPTAASAVQERNPYYKTVKTIEAAGVLGVMALAHTMNAEMGINRLSQNAELLKHNPSPEMLLACSLDVAFTTANVAATYAQVHLSGRLAEHFMKTKAKSVPILSAWGINGDEVDYNMVAENLMTAIVNDDQGDIDTFFMILPKEKKQKVMESIKAITEITDETYSYEEIDQKIFQLENDIEKKSNVRYIVDIVKNAHNIDDLTSYHTYYSFKEKMKMFITTLGGQIGFAIWG